MRLSLGKRYPNYKIHHKKRVNGRWIGLVVLFYLMRLITHQVLFQVVQVQSSSMEPAIQAGDRILVLPWLAGGGWSSSWSFPGIRSPDRGDIVVVLPEAHRMTIRSILRESLSFLSFGLIPSAKGRQFLRRIVGIPGDRVQIAQGEVMIIRDGTRTHESEYASYVTTTRIHPDWQAEYPFSYHDSARVEEEQWYLLADRRDSAFDSRTWGTIPRTRLGGVALFCIWPPRSIRRLH